MQKKQQKNKNLYILKIEYLPAILILNTKDISFQF